MHPCMWLYGSSAFVMRYYTCHCVCIIIVANNKGSCSSALLDVLFSLKGKNSHSIVIHEPKECKSFNLNTSTNMLIPVEKSTTKQPPTSHGKINTFCMEDM